MKKKLILVGAGIVAAGLVIGVIVYLRNDGSVTMSAEALVDTPTLSKLSKKSGSSADISRVGDGIIPPSNSWLSGMVLQAQPKAVFPMPLSFLGTDTGFEIGLPTVTSTATVISGGHVAGVDATIKGVSGFQLTRYDKVSATLTYAGADRAPIGKLTLAEGSPYVFYHSQADHTVVVNSIDQVVSANPSYLRYKKGGHEYAIVSNGGATIDIQGHAATIAAKKGSLLTFYGLPDAGQDSLRTLAGNELSRVDTTISDGVSTSLEYVTANNKPTVFAAMPYQKVSTAGALVASYETIYGKMSALQGTTLTTVVPDVSESNSLDISHLTSAHRQQLIDSLTKDVAGTAIAAKDSYYAGKQLARAANLLDIAKQLGQTEASNKLISLLKSAFAERLGNDYFYYDSELKGVAAQTKAFGSEDFNDHHFHYGYFIYAASILGRYDADFVRSSYKSVNLLVADIANYDTSDSFPVQRNYDPYAGHSWAAGLAPFADGNNQESSSEAIQAWNGVTLWGKLIHNTQLEKNGKWLLANEAATAASAWRKVDTSSPALKGYSAPIASLNFGGKRTYSTFFSDEANAKLGIQLIPLNPMMKTFGADSDTIEHAIGASIKGDNYNVALGDYVLMYLSLHNPQKALELSPQQTDAFIDDGNSRTYFNAWIFTQNDH